MTRRRAAASLGDHAAYHVATDVPGHWFPLVPEQLADGESVRLRLAPLTRLADGTPTAVTPTGSNGLRFDEVVEP